MRLLALLPLLYAGITFAQDERVDQLRVVKSEHRLYLLSHERIVANYRVALGGQPIGAKQREGDSRTPEGRYIIDFKKADSAFFRALHISYPNAADVANAQALGVSPGGAVMIHGQKNGYAWLQLLTQHFDWTNGCIALRNDDMTQVWARVESGTPIELLP